MPQFNAKRQPRAATVGRSPEPKLPAERPATYQNTNLIDVDDLPTMELGPQKVNCRPHDLSPAERGTSHIKR